MKSYFIRRLLLIPPTLLGITLLVFTITRFVPGGPMQRKLQEAAKGADQGGKGSGGPGQSGGLSEEQLEELEEQYGLDKPVYISYLQWLGVMPKETRLSKAEYGSRGEETIGGGLDMDRTAVVVLKNDGRLVHVNRDSNGNVASAVFADTGKPISDQGWKVKIESEKDRQERYHRRNPDAQKLPSYRPRAVAYQTRFSGLLEGDLGRSTAYTDRVDEMILARMPVAAYFGILTAIITYSVCIPLGILKALKHRTFIDSFSSVLIFIGYSIPGFALGAILLVYLGSEKNIFPMFGLTSPDFAQMTFWGQAKDLASHTVLPLLCYVVTGFAMLTMLTKNNLMDNLAADYVRTAVAKGVSFRGAVFRHALRNSMIPIATTLGSLVEVFIGGSMLIETVFDIQGFGLLQYQSVIARDVPVIMGTLTIAGFLLLIGNVLSDFIVALVDPRIKFE
ncbi:ABC transporter permease subunit [Luteolibacter pohnpeiensis]|uniref:ABC transporter permease subunit n=1 Tax=Luteolibacter pohnpeiensis TaxID=454153 RepID=A0A934VUV1_9BACT|nr:ABC transporter permease subunit [Luteolibacter pohnpeiensis]MBK1882922.1 ABC transporter permease subunit [Luteolibacter pohnpeiensis]